MTLAPNKAKISSKTAELMVSRMSSSEFRQCLAILQHQARRTLYVQKVRDALAAAARQPLEDIKQTYVDDVVEQIELNIKKKLDAYP